MRLLFAAGELAPYVTTGGLANAVEGLASALVAAGHDVAVAIPHYRVIEEQGDPVGDGPWRRIDDPGGSTVMLFDDPDFDKDGVYGPVPGTAYDDNWRRYGRFALAVSALAADYDLVHLHDAHVGAVALLTDRPTVFTIHNAAYPLTGPLQESADLLGLGAEVVALGGALEWFGQANYLKAGITGADQVTTVSPGHALELAEDDTSFGLGGVVRALRRPIRGVLNGIDTTSWDPMTDRELPAPFSVEDLRGREKARVKLLAEAGLNDGTVFANVGRMSQQKGWRLLEHILSDLVDGGFRLLLVGSGELDSMIDHWVMTYPGAVARLPYSEPLARLASAGADAYLMPSLFEPSGLGQMYAMRYGCPPVVRLTGGLLDSVHDIDEFPEIGTGIGFRSLNSASLAKTIRRAMRYHTALPALWARMQRNGMLTDWSWSARAAEYEAIYAEL